MCGRVFNIVGCAKQAVAVRHSETGDVVSNKQDSWNFRFHDVLHNVGQDTLYDTLCADIVAKATQGVNGTIFAYGQTGAGKTFTMVRVLARSLGCTPGDFLLASDR